MYSKKQYNKNCLISHGHEKKDFNMDNPRKRRHTGSTDIFEEEPIFSDSEEEKEYSKDILRIQKCLNYKNETHKIPDLEVQCNLSCEDHKVIDIIEKCKSIDGEGVNDDFKPLIDLCKELQFKYRSTTEKRPFGNVTAYNNLFANVIFDDKNLASKNLQDLTPPMSASEEQFCEETFVPSRYGNSNAGSTTIFSQTLCSDSGIANSCTMKSFDSSEEKENVENLLRKSNRIRKPVIPSSGGRFVNRDRKKSSKSRIGVKTKNLKSKHKVSQKTLSRKIKGANIVKQSKVNNRVKIKEKKQNEPTLVKSKTNDTEVFMDIFEDIFHVKAQFLPKNQIKSLARNWMKPKKNIVEINKLRDRPKLRRLYCQDEWLHSEDFTNLCKE